MAAPIVVRYEKGTTFLHKDVPLFTAANVEDAREFDSVTDAADCLARNWTTPLTDYVFEYKWGVIARQDQEYTAQMEDMRS